MVSLRGTLLRVFDAHGVVVEPALLERVLILVHEHFGIPFALTMADSMLFSSSLNSSGSSSSSTPDGEGEGGEGSLLFADESPIRPRKGGNGPVDPRRSVSFADLEVDMEDEEEDATLSPDAQQMWQELGEADELAASAGRVVEMATPRRGGSEVEELYRELEAERAARVAAEEEAADLAERMTATQESLTEQLESLRELLIQYKERASRVDSENVEIQNLGAQMALLQDQIGDERQQLDDALETAMGLREELAASRALQEVQSARLEEERGVVAQLRAELLEAVAAGAASTETSAEDTLALAQVEAGKVELSSVREELAAERALRAADVERLAESQTVVDTLRVSLARANERATRAETLATGSDAKDGADNSGKQEKAEAAVERAGAGATQDAMMLELELSEIHGRLEEANAALKSERESHERTRGDLLDAAGAVAKVQVLSELLDEERGAHEKTRQRVLELEVVAQGADAAVAGVEGRLAEEQEAHAKTQSTLRDLQFKARDQEKSGATLSARLEAARESLADRESRLESEKEVISNQLSKLNGELSVQKQTNSELIAALAATEAKLAAAQAEAEASSAREGVDLNPILSRLDGMESTLGKVGREQQQQASNGEVEVDLTPVLERLDALNERLESVEELETRIEAEAFAAAKRESAQLEELYKIKVQRAQQEVESATEVISTSLLSTILDAEHRKQLMSTSQPGMSVADTGALDFDATNSARLTLTEAEQLRLLESTLDNFETNLQNAASPQPKGSHGGKKGGGNNNSNNNNNNSNKKKKGGKKKGGRK